MSSRDGAVRAGIDPPSQGWSVMAVSLGDGWVLEVHGPAGQIDFLLEPEGSSNLFAPWVDTALASMGVQRCGAWTFTATSFGFRADLEASTVRSA